MAKVFSASLKFHQIFYPSIKFHQNNGICLYCNNFLIGTNCDKCARAKIDGATDDKNYFTMFCLHKFECVLSILVECLD